MTISPSHGETKRRPWWRLPMCWTGWCGAVQNADDTHIWAASVDAAAIWSEFVGHCEDIEADADGGLLRAESEKEKQFCRGQAWAAKSIRRAVVHPKYKRPVG